MAKISLWNPIQGKDYQYIDRIAREYLDLGGTGVFVHKYIGPVIGSGDDNKSNVGDGITTDELTIGDVLFLENRGRNYDPDIIELRGAYTVSDTDFDLSQFGIFLTDDTIFMTFHLNDNVERLGRKLMAGDVLELPHLRDYHPLDPDKPAINRFYVVEDATPSAEGYGPRWWSHLWRVRAKMMPASTEYQDILDRIAGDGQTLESLPPGDDDCCDETVGGSISGGGNTDINDAIEEQAARDVPCDPLHYDAAHLWICIDPMTQEHELIYWKSGDGAPPNGIALAGSGETFPESLQENDYFLRTDFQPRPVLYQKRGTKYYKIEVDQCKTPWTAANQLLDTFIDNEGTMTRDDGVVQDEKTALSKAVRAKPRSGEAQQVPVTDAPDLNGDDADLFGPEFGEEFD
jgi:hypothetical protein